MADISTILNLWFKLRDTNKEYLKIYEVSRRNPWDYTVKHEMEEAFELDPEGFTSLLLLDNFRQDFFENCGISIDEILHNPNYKEFITDCKALTEMLSEDEIVDYLDSFVQSVSTAVSAIGVDREDVAEMLNSRYEIAILRRDALKSMKTLSLHQFFQGDTNIDHLKFLTDIHVWWNMNSLIRCAWNSPDGVSINLIKDPLETSSYFAFVAKNGGNLTVLTDKPKEAHPISKYMSRRPEKEFTRRVFKNHFPYGLLALRVDNKGYLRVSGRGLVPLQEKPIKCGNLLELEPDEIIWIVMMFSLIDQKLYKENYHCGELSYTADMITDPRVTERLLKESPAGALMVRDYKPLTAPELTPQTLENDSQYRKYEGSGLHNWLFERYKDQIPSDIINGILPDNDSTAFLLPDSTSRIVAKEQTIQRYGSNELLLKETDEDKKKYPSPLWSSHFGEHYVHDAIQLQKMTGDEFGSAEQIMNDYRWFARYNAAKFINEKAKEEFEAKKDEVTKWMMERVSANVERLCKDAVLNIEGEKREHPGFCQMFSLKEFEYYDGRNTVKFIKAKDKRRDALANANNARCYFSPDAPCSYIITYRFRTVDDLLYATGLQSVDELPEFLRNYHSSGSSPYTGNHILDRVDPMDWVVHNPWNDLFFSICVGVGKKWLAQARKELNLSIKGDSQNE